jgi:3-hydroxyacyl-CoA dehydrogenase
MTQSTTATRSIDWKRASTGRPFTRVAVLGAGTMGSQIAAHFANAGASVLLLDIAPDGTDNRNAVVETAFKRTKKLKPAPFFTSEVADRIELGNFEDDFDRISEVDWVIEAVVERLDIKQSLMKRVEETIGPDTVVSSNTSGIPIRDVASGRSASFRSRFLGTHFFNPPRYLPLFELIPTDDTDWDVVERVANFARVHLGKGVVVAKDSPYFIGNRIGIYAMMVAIRERTENGFSIEEIDALTGPLVGHPKSATFRTADVVGLDVMKAVIDNLYAAVPDDEERELFCCPEDLNLLVKNGALGAKTRAGFYRKEGKEIKSFNPETGSYESARELNLPELDEIRAAGSLPERMKALFASQSREGDFFRRSTLSLLSYAARRIPEITGSPANVDMAICWGFGWRMGPFQMWDALGFQTVLSAMKDGGYDLPQWIEEMKEGGQTSFYSSGRVYVPSSGSAEKVTQPADEAGLAPVKAHPDRTIWKNEEAGLLDMGDGVALLEFRSRVNTLGQKVVEGVFEAIERVENDPDLRGMVIGNEGSNFSVGANLGEVAMALVAGKFDLLEKSVDRFQQMIQRVHYAEKPVVVAVHQRALGGATEITMACTHPVAAAESYIGLVELGVGLIPAGTGTMRLAALASGAAPNGFASEIQASLARYFKQIAMAQVATSAREAQDMGYLSGSASVVMRAERRFSVAKSEVIRLSEQGYMPPSIQEKFSVLGRQGAAALEIMAYQFHQGRYMSDYDLRLATDVAYVMTGGGLSGLSMVDPQYVLDLEREVFLRLLGEKKTQDRIRYLLENNKPLRN